MNKQSIFTTIKSIAFKSLTWPTSNLIVSANFKNVFCARQKTIQLKSGNMKTDGSALNFNSAVVVDVDMITKRYSVYVFSWDGLPVECHRKWRFAGGVDIGWWCIWYYGLKV